MSVRELISGETIELCNHHNGQPIGLDDQGIHLDKRYNRGASKSGGVKAVIFLDGREIQVKGVKGKDGTSIVSELRKTFNKDEIRERFVKSVRYTLEQLATFSGDVNKYSVVDDEAQKRVLTQAGMDRINDMLEKIVQSFGYTKNDIQSILFTSPSTVVSTYHTTHQAVNVAPVLDPNGAELLTIGKPYKKTMYVKSNLSKQSITITRNRKMLDDEE